MHKKGLTLLEIIVSTIILAITMAGLTNLFISGKRYILRARSRMTGGELGKLFLDPLQMQVRQDQWLAGPNQNCLAAGNCANQTMGTLEGLDRTYTASYTITNDSPINNINKVEVDITWTPPSPE